RESQGFFFRAFIPRLRLAHPAKGPDRTDFGAFTASFPAATRTRPCALGDRINSEFFMPYALFCNDAKLSKTYPTEADVWKLAQQSGLVVDATSDGDKAHPHPVLDNDYQIRACRPDPNEDPVRNKAEAERQLKRDLQFIV